MPVVYLYARHNAAKSWLTRPRTTQARTPTEAFHRYFDAKWSNSADSSAV